MVPLSVVLCSSNCERALGMGEGCPGRENRRLQRSSSASTAHVPCGGALAKKLRVAQRGCEDLDHEVSLSAIRIPKAGHFCRRPTVGQRRRIKMPRVRVFLVNFRLRSAAARVETQSVHGPAPYSFKGEL